MLDHIKGELARRLEESSQQESLQRLYDDQVKILLEAVIAAQNIDDIAVQVKLMIIGKLFKEHRYQESLDALEDLLANQQLLSKDDLLLVLQRKGIALIMMGKYEEAELIFKEMINEEGRAKYIGMINLGIVYCHLTKHSGKKLLNEAVQLFAKADELLAPGKSEGRFWIFYNLAMISYERGRFGESDRHLHSALEHAMDEQQQAMVYNELAKASIAQSKLEQANDYLDAAEKMLIKRLNYNELVLAWNLHIRGLLKKKKGEYTNAIIYFELALNTFVEKELFSEAAEVSYELYVLSKFLDSSDADEYLADYQYYSRIIS